MNAKLCLGFTKSNWDELSTRLKANDASAWNEGIGVFERRIRERYLSCIDALIIADTRNGTAAARSDVPTCIPGFSIIALCCLLIETLESFRSGPIHEAKPLGPCTYPSGACIKPSSGTNRRFIAFLQRPAFGDAFAGKIGREFVYGIRNGVMHDAETRGWVIWRDEPTGRITAPEEDGYALNRTLFYDALKKEFDSYLEQLRDSGNTDLRQNFKARMDRVSEKT